MLVWGFLVFLFESRVEMETNKEKQREFWKQISSGNKQIELKSFILIEAGEQSDGWHQIVHNGEVVQVVHYQGGIVSNLSGAPCSVILSKEGYEKGWKSIFGSGVDPEFSTELVPIFSTDWLEDCSWGIFNTDAQAWFEENLSIIEEYYKNEKNPDYLYSIDISEYEVRHIQDQCSEEKATGYVLVYDGKKLLSVENIFNNSSKHWIKPAFISFDLEKTKEAFDEIGYDNQKTSLEWYWFNNVSNHSYSGNYSEFLNSNIDSLIRALPNKGQVSRNSKQTNSLKTESENKKMTSKKTSKAASGFLSNEKKEAYKEMLKNKKHLAVVGISEFRSKVDVKGYSGIVAFYNEGDKGKKDLKEILVFLEGRLHNEKGPSRVLIGDRFDDSDLVSKGDTSMVYENADFIKFHVSGQAYATTNTGIVSKKDWEKDTDIGFSLDDLVYKAEEVELPQEFKQAAPIAVPVAAKKSNINAIKQVVKSDLSEVATRVAVKKSTEMLSQVVIDFLASNKKGVEASAMKKKVKDLLSTKDGLAAFQLLIGALMPILASHDKVPENIKDVISQVSKGFRTDGMTHFAVEFVDYLSGPAAEQARQTIVKAFEGFKKIDDLASGNINIESQIRALAEPTSLFLVPTKEEEEELDYVSNDDVAATKAKLKSSKLK